MEWPQMFLSIVRETIALFRPYGRRSRSSSVGGSVARANEANVSMTRLTQSICTAFNGTAFNITKLV